MLHTYEKSALAIEVLNRKARKYIFRDFSAKIIVIKTLRRSIRDRDFREAVKYTENLIAKETIHA